MKTSPDCPVDFITINELQVRFVALQVFLLSISYLLIGNVSIMLFLFADFALRAFNLGKWSPLFIVGGLLVRLFRVGNQPVDRAPKRFAAQMGLVFTAAVVLFYFIDNATGGFWFTAMIILFAALESMLGLCAGCYVYNFLPKQFKK